MSMSTGIQPGKIGCPHCGAMIKSAGLAAGAAVNCPKCGQGFRIGQEAVQGPKPKVQSQPGSDVQSSKSKVQGQRPSVPVPPPPPGASPTQEIAGGQAASGPQAREKEGPTGTASFTPSQGNTGGQAASGT